MSLVERNFRIRLLVLGVSMQDVMKELSIKRSTMYRRLRADNPTARTLATMAASVYCDVRTLMGTPEAAAAAPVPAIGSDYLRVLAALQQRATVATYPVLAYVCTMVEEGDTIDEAVDATLDYLRQGGNCS